VAGLGGAAASASPAMIVAFSCPVRSRKLTGLSRRSFAMPGALLVRALTRGVTRAFPDQQTVPRLTARDGRPRAAACPALGMAGFPITGVGSMCRFTCLAGLRGAILTGSLSRHPPYSGRIERGAACGRRTALTPSCGADEPSSPAPLPMRRPTLSSARKRGSEYDLLNSRIRLPAARHYKGAGADGFRSRLAARPPRARQPAPHLAWRTRT
jgi:hypothetical protein